MKLGYIFICKGTEVFNDRFDLKEERNMNEAGSAEGAGEELPGYLCFKPDSLMHFSPVVNTIFFEEKFPCRKINLHFLRVSAKNHRKQKLI